MGSAVKDFANEDREGAAVRRKGVANHLNRQEVANLAAGDPAFRVTAGIGAPGDEGVVLGRCGVAITEVAVGEDGDDFRVGRRVPEAALFVAVTEDEGTDFRARLVRGDLFRYRACIGEDLVDLLLAFGNELWGAGGLKPGSERLRLLGLWQFPEFRKLSRHLAVKRWDQQGGAPGARGHAEGGKGRDGFERGLRLVEGVLDL